MNPDKTYTYNKDDFKWTMDDIVTEKYTYIPTNNPDAACANGKNWRMIPELPFWWFLNPWKTVEDLRSSLLKVVAVHAEDAKGSDSVAEILRQTVYNRDNELETVKAERDAANQAVRYLRNKRKKCKRRG